MKQKANEIFFQGNNGKTFNQWQISGISSKNGYILAICTSCNYSYEVSMYDIKYNKSKSCANCSHLNLATKKRAASWSENNIGKTINYWTIIKTTTKTKIECVCICGNKSEMRSIVLKNGNSKSCGCKMDEIRKKSMLTLTGYEHALQNPISQAKYKNTCMEKFGTPHPNQNSDILSKGNYNVKLKYNYVDLKTNKIYKCTATWELALVKTLLENDILFEKEPRSFQTPEGNYYIPDFYLPDYDLWIEVKGSWRGNGKQKWEWFHKKYPNSQLIMKKDLMDMGIVNNQGKIFFDPKPYKQL